MESCSTRMIKTSDGEDQKNGTYYSFQASTSGSGAAITTDNTNTPDTFCPLGWQLPYSGTGGDYYNKSRSWRYLYDLYGYGSDTSGEIGVTSSPLSFVLSGFYSWGAGRLYRLENNGTYWSMTVYTNAEAYSLGLYAGVINIAAGYAKNVGRALRCASGLVT